MEHLKDLLHSHHGADGEDADTLMDKCMKGMSTDGTGGSETDPGEAGMVQAGEIPEEDEVFKSGRRQRRKDFVEDEVVEEAKSVSESEGEYWVEYDDGTRRGPFASHEDAMAAEGGMEDKDLDLVEWAEREEAEPEHGGEELVGEVAEDVEEDIAGISPDEDTEEILERYQHPKSKKWLTRKVGTLKRVNGKTFIVKDAEGEELVEEETKDEDYGKCPMCGGPIGATGACMLCNFRSKSAKSVTKAAKVAKGSDGWWIIDTVNGTPKKIAGPFKSEAEAKHSLLEYTNSYAEMDLDEIEEKDAVGEEIVEEETKDNDEPVDPEVLRRFKRLTKNLELNGFLPN